MVNISKYIKDHHIPLCICALGLALGYLGYHTVRWLIKKNEKIAAAEQLQGIWRAYRAKVKAEKERQHLLHYSLLEKAKLYVDIPSNRKGLPIAPMCKTNVYLPQEPIVLKHTGAPKNQERFDQMKEAREICSGYKHLVIPKARVYRDFIVEERLPIIAHETKEHIGFYIDNCEKVNVHPSPPSVGEEVKKTETGF